jgi:hypothetical protein
VHTTSHGQPRSRTLLTHDEPNPTNLESVLEGPSASDSWRKLLPSQLGFGTKRPTWTCGLACRPRYTSGRQAVC